MSNSARGLKFWTSAWLPVAVAIALVAIESTAFFGADRTSPPLRHIWEWLFGPISEGRWHYIHLAIRKSGHFLGFGFVGLTWLRAWWITLPRAPFLRVEMLAFLGTALVACGDEYHQSFLPNRTSSPRDVLLDCIGALVTMSVVYLIIRQKSPEKLARAA
ncbi:MAG: VanZ family protein [Terracidiphilus sp.]